ncbi:MAG: hypothetical protein NTW85_16300 [Methylococcales bacterium]|nr:hypothetical protein [Methylococcales bacterium]
MPINPQDLLSNRTKELIQVVGYDAAIALVNHFGGRHLNIPKKLKHNHLLVSLIDFSVFEKLCKYYGGTVLEIDLCTRFFCHQKQLLIMDSVKLGMTNAQLAKQFNTTERQIRRVKQSHRGKP